MSEIRSVSVHLDADVASYVAKMRLAGAETDKAFSSLDKGRLSTLNRQLTGTSTRLDKVTSSASKLTSEGRRLTGGLDRVTTSSNRTTVATRGLGNEVDRSRVKVDTGAKSIDRYSGRLALFTDLIVGIGPALIPIGAVAVPAVAALGAGALFAAGAFGVTKLAVVGVSNALKLANKAALDPTTTNLQAARLALDALPPSARAFTLELQHMTPALDQLRSTAADGFLPGATQGLHALLGDLPIVRQDIGAISGEMGILARDTGQALSSSRWKPFLRFVGQEAPTGLGVMGRSVGAVGHGLAALFMAFTPATHDLERGILNVSRDFDHWATSLDKTKGFESFLEYVDTNGPKVLALLGATASTFLDISRAAAPLGGPILDTLTTLFHIIDAIASSNLGTPIFTGIVAMRLMARTTELWGKVSTTSAGQFIAGQRDAVAAIRATITSEQRAVMTTQELAAAQQKTSAGWATIRGGALKAGAAGLGFGLIASGVTDKLHLTDTATLAMAGSLAGPWGAAIGAGAGLLLDFTHHQDNSAAATTDFTSTLDRQTGAITDNTRALAAQVLQQDGAFKAANSLNIGLDTLTSAALGNKSALAEVNGQLDFYLKKTQPGYTAGGANIIPPEQVAAAGQLSEELGKVGGNLADDQAKTRELSAAVGHNVTTTNSARRAHIRLAASLEAERQAALATATQFQTLGKDLDNAKVSLNGWIRQMQHEADALINFGNNARSAADRGLREGLIKQLETLGPAGALRMRQLADATQSQIARANHAFDTYHRGAQNLIDANAYLSNHPPILTVNGVPQSLQALREVAAELNSLHNKTITLTTVRSTGGHSIAGNAAGGTVPGPRYPYADKVLRMVAPGEEIISNSRGQADMNRPALKAANRGARLAVIGQAAGGTVSRAAYARAAVAGPVGVGSGTHVVERVIERLAGSVRMRIGDREFTAYVEDISTGVYQVQSAEDRHFYGKVRTGG